MTSELKSILFLDIETIRGEERYEQLHERLKAQWARKASFLKREEGHTDADLYHERAGIYAEFGKVIVIALGKYTETEKGQPGLKTRYLAGDDEKKL
ncbi:MAG TPA: 3'-5' exonuclease, partial [Cytophagales bacterium]|nr:3'-5' exonuclease [Cytophagales bacterium]